MEQYYRPLIGDDGDFDTTRFSGFVELQKPGIKQAVTVAGFDFSDFAAWFHEGKLFPLQKVRVLPRILRNEKARESFLKHGARKAEAVLEKPDLSRTLQEAEIGQLARALLGRIAAPFLPDVAPVRAISRLVAHWERPDTYPELFVERDVQAHALEQVSWGVVKVIEHVVRELGQAKLVRKADRLLVGALEAKVIEGDPKRPEGDRRKLAKVELVLAEDAGVDPLVEVHSTQRCDAFIRSSQLGAGRESKIPDLRDDVLEAGRRDDVVIHQNEVLLRTIEFIDRTDETRQGLRVALPPYQLRHAAECAFADAAAGRVGALPITDGSSPFIK